MRTAVKVAVVGARPGDPVVRTFGELPQAALGWVCNPGALRMARAVEGSSPRHTPCFDDVLEDETVDAVVFAGTAATQRGRALAALEAEKHVLVDGPLAFTSAEADALVKAAAGHRRWLWAHTDSREGPVVRQVRQLADAGALGEIFYLHLRRSVGPDADLDLVWGLCADAVTLTLELLGDEPVEVTARAQSYLSSSMPDVIFAELRFATGIGAYLHLSSRDRQRVERLAVVGSEGTAVADASAGERALELYLGPVDGAVDAGPAAERPTSLTYRIAPANPLRAACARFVSCVRSHGEPNHGRDGAAVVAVVEALERSMVHGGITEGVEDRSRPAEGVNVVQLRGR